ncbi:MAG: hypothetical protein KC418_03290 [Anaerolineales bacterium]|nr:hypothetical protein [Anaerolineales bacterium]MCB8950677.1 hypothetical protein [Ardenticatenales bacterium]
MNKLTKILLRLWISLMSVATFVAGWAMLSHAQKPAPLTPTAPAQTTTNTTINMPELAPIPSLEELVGSNETANQPVFVQPSVSTGFPRMRTRGS